MCDSAWLTGLDHGKSFKSESKCQFQVLLTADGEKKLSIYFIKLCQLLYHIVNDSNSQSNSSSLKNLAPKGFPT